ncbi:MAG: HTTM domain-containing protein, partial [Saprospiraceae bacterium]
RTHVHRYNIDVLKLLMCIVYCYAGLAKLNSDWLLNAQPLQIWLMGKYDIPIIGEFLQWRFFHYLFSWAGAAYDLLIWIFLLYAPTRVIAFVFVVIFHVLTAILFPIGMFPYLMIFSATIFFSADFHKKILDKIGGIFKIPPISFDNGLTPTKVGIGYHAKRDRTIQGIRSLKIPILTTFLLIQLLFPFRYLSFPGELFWTEEGYRFSWRVMLMEKAGYANFKVVDPDTGKRFYVTNGDFLTTFQEKQMSTQPDFILEYAHHLEGFYKKNKDLRDPEIYVESYVALNGRSSQPYVDPTVDLTKIERAWWHRHSTWLMPFGDEIKGL